MNKKQKVEVTCPECKKIRMVTLQSLHGKGTIKICRSCDTKRRWQNEEFRKAVTNSNSKTWSQRTDELSERSIKLWQSQEFRNIISNKLSEHCLQNDIKPACDPAEAAKAGWNSEEYRKTISESMKAKWKDEEYRKQQIALIKSGLGSVNKTTEDEHIK